MINVTDLRNGTTFFTDGRPYQVVKYTHIKMGRGGALVKVIVRNLENGAGEEKTFSSNIKVEKIVTEKKSLQFLYKDKLVAIFMDQKNFDQIEIPLKVIGSDIDFISEGELVDIIFWDKKALSINISPIVALKVAETGPNVKGNSATNIYKSAILENGLEVKVPLFIKEGEKIKIDTRTKEYVSRFLETQE